MLGESVSAMKNPRNVEESTVKNQARTKWRRQTERYVKVPTNSLKFDLPKQETNEDNRYVWRILLSRRSVFGHGLSASHGHVFARGPCLLESGSRDPVCRAQR